MNYLARLKEMENTKFLHITPDSEPTKPTKGGSDGFVGSVMGVNENIYSVPAVNHEDDFVAELTPADRARHDRVLKMLDDNPEICRAIIVDDLPDHSIMTVALRDVAVVTLELPADYDRFALLALIEQHGQTTQ